MCKTAQSRNHHHNHHHHNHHNQKAAHRASGLVMNLASDGDGVAGPPFGGAAAAWHCAVCTFENTKSQVVCDMCGRLRDDPNVAGGMVQGRANPQPPEEPARLTEEELANKHWNYIVR